MNAADLEAAQALADVDTIGLLQHRAGREAQLLAEQLSYALNNRVTIEQAKGVLAERLQIQEPPPAASDRRPQKQPSRLP